MDDAETAIALEMRTHADTIKAITLNVSQMDGVIAAPKAKEELFEKPAPKLEAPKPAEVEEVIEEPKKVVKKSAAPAENKAELADIVGEWDD